MFKESDFFDDNNQLILLIDDKESEVTPQFVKALTDDLIRVISRHIEIDRTKVTVSISTEENLKKIVIHIPVLNVPRGQG